MTVEHVRRVELQVIDGEHQATFSIEQLHHWPGHPAPHISTLIQQICDEMIEQIRMAEEGG